MKLQLQNVSKIYPSGNQAVCDMNLTVNEGELVVLVGPSGCGKTTTLRMIAGLETITSGELRFDGRRQNEASPRQRGVAMVFQTPALIPYLSVYENMAYGLRRQGLSLAQMDERVRQVAQQLELQDLLERRPSTLSGGQQQRVALGRAMTRKARLMLMDEPLSSLDAALRDQMRHRILDIHHQTPTTTLMVTHDQAEAMAMADRIVVMKEGRIQQVGTPAQVYAHPANLFTAGFIGSPAMNLLQGDIEGGWLNIGAQRFPLPDAPGWRTARKVVAGVRCEQIRLDTENPRDAQARIQIRSWELLGWQQLVYGTLEGQPLRLLVPFSQPLSPGERLVSWKPDAIHLFDPLDGSALDPE